MKVKELIEQLQNLDQEKEVCYEHLFIDYVLDSGNCIDLGGCR